jgi:hypothetical protein
MISLGQYVRDTVTEFVGVVVCRAVWLNGCVRLSVQPKVGSDGKLPEMQWIDEPQCVVIGGKPEPEVSRAGGPRNDPARPY